METTASILGAFDAHKLPSQTQTNLWIDWLVLQIDATTSTMSSTSTKAQLSTHGVKLGGDFKELLLAYKELGVQKNGDDQLQIALWNISQGHLDVNAAMGSAKDQSISDVQQISLAIQNILTILWRHFISASVGMGDLASLARNILADTAEMVEQRAGSAKISLRETEEESQHAKCDQFVPDPTTLEGVGDSKRRFESGMDTAKSIGSHAIGAGQSVRHGASELGDKVTDDLENVFDAVLERAQTDPAYRDSLTTIFDLGSKWFNKSLDVVDATSTDEFVLDPSGRIPAAVSSFNTLIERLAGGKTTRGLTEALRAAVIDIRHDPELHSFFHDFHDFVRRTLYELTYAHSHEHNQRRIDLRERWQQLQRGENRREWHDHVDKIQSEISDYLRRIDQDRDVRSLRDAYLALSKDFAEAATSLGTAATGDAHWIWQDVVNVLLPKGLEALKQLPIPRTEYKGSGVEFVIEDLNISSLRLLPGQAHVRNTTDMHVVKGSQDVEASTEVKSKTQIHLKGVQFKANDVSFWYHDEAMPTISEASGLMGVSVPEEGVDVDISLGLIPQPSKKANDSHQHAFFTIDHVNVKLNNPNFTIRKSNHPVLFTAFKPMVRNRIEKLIETSLAQQITTAIQFLDELAFDVHRRADVFRDMGVAPMASYLSAMWSEIGHIKEQPSIFSGLKTTSVGVVRDDPRTDARFAIGTQPQIIPGEKHGPAVTGSNPQAKRDQAVRLAEESKDRRQKVGYQAESGVNSFVEEIKIKSEQESRSESWRSVAFDAPIS